MKVIIVCDSCGNIVNLSSSPVNEKAYFQRVAQNIFSINENDIEIDVDMDITPSLENSFVEKLSEADDEKEIYKILDNEIMDNVSVDVETKLKSLKIECENCGESMTVEF